MTNQHIPETVNVGDVASWSDETDVVVLGFGIAGGCAAVSAASVAVRVARHPGNLDSCLVKHRYENIVSGGHWLERVLVRTQPADLTPRG